MRRDRTNLRAHLDTYTHAARQIELAEVAIEVLERMNASEATRAINILKRGQQRYLRWLDAAEVKLTDPITTGGTAP